MSSSGVELKLEGKQENGHWMVPENDSLLCKYLLHAITEERFGKPIICYLACCSSSISHSSPDSEAVSVSDSDTTCKPL